VAEVGRAVGLSERALRRHFVAVTGMTWRRYLLESRLLRATARLADPNSNITDIGTEVGFASASAFSRAFRRYAGNAPGAYRRGIAAVSAGSEDAEGRRLLRSVPADFRTAGRSPGPGASFQDHDLGTGRRG
jgi:AraC-like DNA-binding protein